MRPDPHAGYVPGLGCGCPLCREPLPDLGPANPLEGHMRRQLYESGRDVNAEAAGRTAAELDVAVAVNTEPS